MNTRLNGQDTSLDHDARLTAYALHELSAREQAEVQARLAADPQEAKVVAETKLLAEALREAYASPVEPPHADTRQAVVARLGELEGMSSVELAKPVGKTGRRKRWWVLTAVAACLVVVVLAYPAGLAIRDQYVSWLASGNGPGGHAVKSNPEGTGSRAEVEVIDDFGWAGHEPGEVAAEIDMAQDVDAAPVAIELRSFAEQTAPRQDREKNSGALYGTGLEGRSASRSALVRVYGGSPPRPSSHASATGGFRNEVAGRPGPADGEGGGKTWDRPVGDRTSAEQYELPPENAFLPVDQATALSTFSIDVDTASYANVRRFLNHNLLPPPAAVRIEEMVNYFRYTYPQPQGGDPFSVNLELADCPWQPGHDLLRIGIQGKEVAAKERKAGNLVFLIDVSGSMQPENKLPLLKQALKMLAGELTENDSVTICTYAGDAGLKLAATNGTQQNVIRAAIDSLSAGGSTHGSAGIELAYEQAAKSFIKGGTNRVILATDGDLNVGITDDAALVDLIKTKAASGVFLTVLGVGEGNLKDAKMEKLADNGNGVYAYLDSLREARKVLVEQLAGSLETIAKDVKIQIEFNPAVVKAYRLIGYENRVLAARDFHDDKKDAGEIGAGHTVTALYELIPARSKPAAKPAVPAQGVDPLKYQKAPEVKPAAPESLTPAADSGEAFTLKLRYKQPDGDTSTLREYPFRSDGCRFNRASADFQFAAAVASFGMLLRGSEHRGDATFAAIEEIAAGSLGQDTSGYRAEFLDLVRKAKTLAR